MANPKAGQLTVVRGRPAVVRDVNETTDTAGTICLLNVEYIDGDSFPLSEWVAWDRESHAQLIAELSFPQISTGAALPEPPTRFAAFLNSYRWSSHNRVTASRDEDEKVMPLVSPWHNAVQIEDYQLYPVQKSLLMPRVSLLLADDVGLGKTIEAGLILSELYSRRKVQRTLVICPASLQHQWREELADKFHLDFVVVNREEHNKTRRQFGVDANPWTIYPRIITSMDYLRQPDILESFRATAASLFHAGRLPFQMLIVDEAHNLSPNMFSDDSDRCRMLRQVSRYFEHKLFLSATPHNGYTPTFSGLLSILDPVRIQQTGTLTEDDHKQIRLMMVRRLKSELNTESNKRRFVTRNVQSESIDLLNRPLEKQLYEQLRDYRRELISKALTLSPRERRICEFVITLLTKRLLSSTYAFSKTWWQHVEGLSLEPTDIDEVETSVKKAQVEPGDDTVKDIREEDAARQSGSWMTQYASKVRTQMDAVADTLKKLGWKPERFVSNEALSGKRPIDAKLEKLLDWIERNLIKDGKFLKHERLIVFTEYKDTLNYLVSSLDDQGYSNPQVDYIFGGMETSKREQIKEAFNDPASPVRILVATDTAAEGLNLQMTCRYIFHYDIPWNPMRLEQRNGRIDRHGQSRDVTVHHFTTEDDADYKFLSHVITKVNQAREDLGSLGQIIDHSVMEHFTGKGVDPGTLDERLDLAGESKQDSEDTIQRDTGSEEDYRKAMRRLEETEAELGLKPEALANLLAHAAELEGGHLVETNDKGVYRLHTVPPGWKTLVEKKLSVRRGDLSGLPKLVFDPSYFETLENEKLVFRLKPDTVLLRLGHPVMRRAIGVLQRKLWDSAGELRPESGSISRWTVTQSALPAGVKAMAVVYCLLEVTNELRETAHQEFLEIPFDISNGAVKPVEEETWRGSRTQVRSELDTKKLPEAVAQLRSNWIDIEDDLKKSLAEKKRHYRSSFKKILDLRRKEELKLQKKDLDTRIGDLEKRDEAWLEKQKRIHEKQMARLSQTEMFDKNQVEKDITMRQLEWETYKREHKQLLDLLKEERKRTLETIIPKRYSLSNLEFWPIGVEFITNGSEMK